MFYRMDTVPIRAAAAVKKAASVRADIRSAGSSRCTIGCVRRD